MQCSNCQKALQGDFKFCPYCGVEVINNNTCRNCRKEVDPAWVSCPYCGSDLKAPVQRPARQQPPHRPLQHPPYAHGHGHYYDSSSSGRYRKRKGFLGRLFS